MTTSWPALRRRGLRAAWAATTVAATVAAVGVAPPPPAWAAAARVTFTPATLDPDYATTLSLRGTGFQAIKGGFGGVYVLFGTVGTAWQPSKGGTSGVDYVYVQDEETKDNHGYQKFISFQDGGTLSAANGGIVNPDGTWATTLIVPGAKFPARGRDGGIEQIDCLKVRCGIITIGAHGVVDPQNETFTPVAFATPKQVTPPPAKPASGSPSTGAGPASDPGTHNADGPLAGASGSTDAADRSLAPAAAQSRPTSMAGWWFATAAAMVLLGVGGILAWRRRMPPAAGRGAS
jgi:hypothetical protein